MISLTQILIAHFKTQLTICKMELAAAELFWTNQTITHPEIAAKEKTIANIELTIAALESTENKSNELAN